ncbi:MAG: PAS domain-containing protein [Methanocalculaceae archaeon]|nr:PAS domain-containing protein [Methanocalculaceae archaeon]
MSVTEIAEAEHLNRNTVARYMDTLLVSGQVEMRTFGKAKVFFLAKRVPVSAMLNLSSEMVLLVDADLGIMQTNEALLSFLSITSDEIIGSRIYDGPAKPLCSDMLIEHIRRALRGDTVRGELRLFQNGQEYHLDQKIYPMVLADGKPGVTVVLDDITEHVRTVVALEQSETMFRRLVETVQDCIWSVDARGVIRCISPQITAICGYTPEELIDRVFFPSSCPREPTLDSLGNCPQRSPRKMDSPCGSSLWSAKTAAASTASSPESRSLLMKNPICSSATMEHSATSPAAAMPNLVRKGGNCSSMASWIASRESSS